MYTYGNIHTVLGKEYLMRNTCMCSEKHHVITKFVVGLLLHFWAIVIGGHLFVIVCMKLASLSYFQISVIM